jgi:hypothetical protein
MQKKTRPSCVSMLTTEALHYLNGKLQLDIEMYDYAVDLHQAQISWHGLESVAALPVEHESEAFKTNCMSIMGVDVGATVDPCWRKKRYRTLGRHSVTRGPSAVVLFNVCTSTAVKPWAVLFNV